jgi:purine-binding chemotaxis protein CheW
MNDRKGIAWESLRLRLERSRAALEKASAPETEKVQAVYRQRARRLARRLEGGSGQAEDLSILVFEMGKDRYGIELSQLAEVIPHPLLAPVPGAPAQLAGVLQVRGQVRPVWELCRLLGLPDLEAGDSESVLLLRKGSREVGLRVGLLEGMRTLRPEERGRPPVASPHVRWITSDLIAILNPEELFKEET